MAETTTRIAGAVDTVPPLTTMAVLAPALGWLIPGAGHFIQRRWIRGLLLMPDEIPDDHLRHQRAAEAKQRAIQKMTK